MNYSNISYYLNVRGLNYCLKNGQIFYPQTIKNILSDLGFVKCKVTREIKNTKDQYKTVNRKCINERFLDSRKNLTDY